jgi:NADPH:quinone reductase-like Zn-dependent oxidoreductase
MKTIALHNPGPEYRLELASAAMPAPGDDEVLIRVAAAGVNRADILQARGAKTHTARAKNTLCLEVYAQFESKAITDTN